MEKVKWLKGNGIREWCPPCATAMVKTRREASGSPPQASRRKPSNPLYAAVHLPAHAFSPYRDRLTALLRRSELASCQLPKLTRGTK
jgi:hypothetical protein